MLLKVWYDTVMRYNKGNTATHKKCPKCGLNKERSEYWNDVSRPDKITAYCKMCKEQITNTHVSKNIEYYKKSRTTKNIQNKYNLSVKDFEKMLKQQNYECKICKKSLKKYSAIDHNHQTGVIRGVLCRKCNVGLGFFKDNIKNIKNAIKYLEYHENM